MRPELQHMHLDAVALEDALVRAPDFLLRHQCAHPFALCTVVRTRDMGKTALTEPRDCGIVWHTVTIHEDLPPRLASLLKKADKAARKRCLFWHIRDHERDDYIQDVRMRVWQFVQRGGHLPDALLLRMVYRTMVSTTRRLAGANGQKRSCPLPSEPESTHKDERTDHYDLLRYIHSRASPRMRKVLSMRLEGMRVNTIARRLHVRRGTVKTILERLQQTYRLGTK